MSASNLYRELAETFYNGNTSDVIAQIRSQPALTAALLAVDIFDYLKDAYDEDADESALGQRFREALALDRARAMTHQAEYRVRYVTRAGDVWSEIHHAASLVALVDALASEVYDGVAILDITDMSALTLVRNGVRVS